MTTTTAQLGKAETEAADTAAAIAEAEGKLASGEGTVTAGKLHALRDKFRHASLTADGLRTRAERERRDARLAGLEQLGAEIDDVAAAGTGMDEALQALAAAAGKVRQLAAGHDARVQALMEAAADLGAEPQAPAGPRASSAYVTATPDSVQHRCTRLHLIARNLGTMISHAVAGDPVSAMAAARMITVLPSPKRAAHYFRGGGGQILSFDDPLHPGIAAQVRSGQVTPLTESEIRAFLAGDLA